MAKEEKKARIPSAQKKWRQSEEQRMRNKAFRSKTKTAIKDFEAALSSGKKDDAKAALSAVYSLFDKGHKKGVFKQNTVARLKSRITARLVAVA